jgi:hypothetical protein
MARSAAMPGISEGPPGSIIATVSNHFSLCSGKSSPFLSS